MTSTSSTSRRALGVKGDWKATLIAIRGFHEGWPTIKRQVRYQFFILLGFAIAGYFRGFTEIAYLVLIGIQIAGIYGEMKNSADEVDVDSYVEEKCLRLRMEGNDYLEHHDPRDHHDEWARKQKDLSAGAMTPIAVGGIVLGTIMLIWPI
jgi:diacylglycerol kinase